MKPKKPSLESLLRRAGSATRAPSGEPFFHATIFAHLASIQEHGLRPRRGGGTFRHGGYDSHSQGKVFLAEGLDAALAWFSKIEDIADYNAGDHGELAERVPVLLRANVRGYALHLDPLGDRDVHGSWYVERAIPPARLVWWHPRHGWVPLSAFDTWLSVEPDLGVESWDEPDRDEDEDDEERWDDEDDGRTPNLFGAYDRGGFKPRTEDEACAPVRWRPPRSNRPRASKAPPPPPLSQAQRAKLDREIHEVICPTIGCTCGRAAP